MGQKRVPLPQLRSALSRFQSGSRCKTPWASHFVISRGYAGEWWARAEFGTNATRSQLPKATAWLGEPISAPVLPAPRRPCSHAPAAMQGSPAELMPTFLRLAVLQEKGKDVSGRKTERGESLLKCTPQTTTARFSELDLQMASAVLPMFWNTLITAESHVGGRNDLFRRRKEEGERDSDTSRFSTLTYLWCCRELSAE